MSKRKFIFVGVDPGLSGGIVAIDSDLNLLGKFVMPTTAKKLLDLLAVCKIFLVFLPEGEKVKVFLEEVHSMPKQGVASSFKFGRVFGAIEGVLTALNIPYELVSPQKWQNKIHVGIKKELPPKKRSSIAVSKLFPRLDLRATERCKKPHEGLVDALLIAMYGVKYGSSIS